MTGPRALPLSTSRRRLLAVTALVPTVAAGLVTLVPQVQAADLTCVLVPQLRDVAVSQGISGPTGYPVLARGKETLVKAFLSKPACATMSDRIKVESASLQVTFPGSTATPTLPSTITGPVFPELLNFSAAPGTDAAGDPVFSVPGSLLDASTGRDARATASFTMSVNYTSTNSLGITTSGTTTLRPSATAPTATAVFEKASNAARLLVVVMGDPSKGFTANWPGRTAPERADGADDVLLRAMQAVQRVGPFKDGVAKDLGSIAGIRYAIAPTVLDVRQQIQSDGKFCGSSANFPALRSQLSSFLTNWQAANAETKVDKVLGVVWGPNSKGPKQDTTCADGYASVGGGQAWARIAPDTTGGPGNAGSLVLMETVGHNFGSVPQDRDVANDAFHSAADAGAGTRGYNVLERSYLTAPPSVLKYSSQAGWNDYTTLLRKEDYAYTLCRVTPASPDSCRVDQIDLNANAEPIGAPAQLQQVFTIAGVTGGNLADTDLNTFLSPDTAVTQASTTSAYRLVQRSSAAGEPIVSTTRFAVQFEASEHRAGAEDHAPLPQGNVDVRFEAHPSAAVFEVYNGDPLPANRIYRAVRTGAPLAVDSQLSPGVANLVNLTAGRPGGGSEAALAPAGPLVAYTAGAGVVVTDSRTAATSAPVAGASSASWLSPTSLVYVRAGDVLLATVTPGATPTITGERVLYDSSRQVALLAAPASHPAADAAGGDDVLVSIAGDLWQIDVASALLSANGVTCRVEALEVAGCRRITSDAAVDTEPAYDGPNRAVFTRDGALRALALPSGEVEPTTLPGGAQASVSSPTLAYSTGSGIGLADSKTFSSVTTDLLSSADSDPSLVDRRIAFTRTATGRSDVLVGGLTTNRLDFSARDDGGLTAEVFAVCDGLSYPIFVDTPPSVVRDGVSTWRLEWDGAGSTCATPTVYALVHDSVDAVRIDLGAASGAADPAAAVDDGAVYAPGNGRLVLQYDSVSLAGDVPVAPAGELGWHVSGPGYDRTLAFTRGASALALPPSGGWVDGATYTVELLRAGQVRATGTFVAQADKDHDNLSFLVEKACFGADADLDPTNVNLDTDADGEVNGNDAFPCRKDTNVTVDFDPNSLNPTSNGNTVTLYLTGSAVDLRGIPASGFAATRIGNLDADIHAVVKEGTSASAATLKLPRQAFLQFVSTYRLTGYVPVVITATSSAGSIRGIDLTDPVIR